MTKTGVALIWSKGGFDNKTQTGYALIVAGEGFEELNPVTFMNEYNGRHARFKIAAGMHLVECSAGPDRYPRLTIYKVIKILPERSVVETVQIYYDGNYREDYPRQAWEAVQAAYYTAAQRNCRKCHHMKDRGNAYGG